MSEETEIQSDFELEQYICRISVRFFHILRPFHLPNFITTLSRLGYQLMIPPPPTQGVPDIHVSFGYIGDVAMKDGITFDLHCEKQFFGIKGPTIQATITEFINVFNALEEDGIIIPDNVLFYEFNSRFDYRLSKVTPIELMQKSGKRSSLIKRVNDNMKLKTGLFSISLGSLGGVPDSSDYFEVQFRPIPSKLENTLGIRIVNRNKDFEEFTENISSIEEDVHNLVQTLFE